MVAVEQPEVSANEMDDTTPSETDIVAYGMRLVTPLAQDYAVLQPHFACDLLEQPARMEVLQETSKT